MEAEKSSRLDGLAQEFRRLVARSVSEQTDTPAGPSWPEQLEHKHADDIAAVAVHQQGGGDAIRTGESAEYALRLAEPLNLGAALSFHQVDSKYLWVSTFEAGLLVLDQNDHELFAQLADGRSPADVLDDLSRRGLGEQEAWGVLAPLLGRIASAGFIDGIRGHVESRIPTPAKFARFHLTKACHLRCIHCYADSSPDEDRSRELPVERWARLTHEFAANGGQQVLFTGGEALMHRGCIELMNLARELGLYVTLFTNGLLVPRYLEHIRASVDKVQVSLDGPDAATNDAIRGNGVFRAAVRAIDALLGANVATQVGMTVMNENWSAWKTGFLPFAQKYAHSPLEFKLSYGINTYGRAENMTEMDVNVTRPTVDALMAAVSTRKGPKVFRAQSGCGYCEQFVVGPDGTVYPCHLLDAPVCHIDEHPVAEIISMLTNLARLVDVDHVEGCKDCDIRYLCGGTCRVVDGRKTGTRLKTTCTAEIKERKYRSFVEHFAS